MDLSCYRCGKQPCECRDGLTLYRQDDAELWLRDGLPLAGMFPTAASFTNPVVAAIERYFGPRISQPTKNQKE